MTDFDFSRIPVYLLGLSLAYAFSLAAACVTLNAYKRQVIFGTWHRPVALVLVSAAMVTAVVSLVVGIVGGNLK